MLLIIDFANYLIWCFQDEADEMLTRELKDQIYEVYRYLRPDLQV